MVDAVGTEKADQTEMLLAIHDLKSSIVAEMTKSKESFWWKVTQVVLPVVLTAIVGFFVFLAQSNVQQTLSLQKTRFIAEFGLRQVLFERRLDAYKQIYDKAYAAYLSMKSDNPQGAQDQLDREMKMLSELTNDSKILSSAALQKLLVGMWIETIKRGDPGTTEKFLEEVAKQMRRDLNIEEMDVVGH